MALKIFCMSKEKFRKDIESTITLDLNIRRHVTVIYVVYFREMWFFRGIQEISETYGNLNKIILITTRNADLISLRVR